MALKTRLDKLKKMTERISKWESSNLPFGYFLDIKDNSKEDKIYEFYVYMRIIKDLQSNYNIKFIPNTKGIFPKAPALKQNFSYFTAVHKKDTDNSYQICYGTKIQFSFAPKTLTAPDISFQDIDSPKNPTEKNVLIIMDVKYKYEKSDAISVDLIHAFMQLVNSLQTTNASKEKLQFSKLLDFKSNCLISNGGVLNLHDDYCKQFFIKQIGHFWATEKIVTSG